MPFKSQAQRRMMYATHPKLAAEMESKTPKGKKLPEHVKPKKNKKGGEEIMGLYDELSPEDHRKIGDCIFALFYLGDMISQSQSPLAAHHCFVAMHESCQRALKANWSPEVLEKDKQTFIETFELSPGNMPKLISLWNYFSTTWLDIVDPKREKTTMYCLDEKAELVIFSSPMQS